MERITRWVLAHKRIVVGFWLVLTLVGIASAGSATKALKQKFSVPGKEGWETNQQIAREFHGTGGNAAPLVPVVTLPAGTTVASPGVRDQLQGIETRVHLSGFDALQAQSGGGNGPGVLLEALLGGAGALAVLAFVFASFLALVPMLMAVVSIMTTFLLVWGLTTITEVSPIVQFLVALIGLGVAIDYSLLVASRWREERAHGRSGEEAVQRAMETAGRAVVFSGTTVA